MMFFAEVICVDKRKKEATKGPIHTGKSGSDPLISFLPHFQDILYSIYLDSQWIEYAILCP